MSARVLVACEYSGVVRDAFAARGHDAWSCDLLPTEAPGNHVQGDVLDILGDGWDLMIAHPPCTYLTRAGERWLYEAPVGRATPGVLFEAERWRALDQAAEFFRALLDAPVLRVAVENPAPHRHALERIGRRWDQAVQPWWFGHGETKRTCLWLRNLPPLMATRVATGREGRIHRLGPSADHWKQRSTTFTGMAEAMAAQWGPFVERSAG